MPEEWLIDGYNLLHSITAAYKQKQVKMDREILLAQLSGFAANKNVRLTAVLDGSGQPLNQERFLIRRGRLHADVHRGDYFATFELDGNTIQGATARLLGASVGWSYSPTKAKPPLVA